MNHDDDQQFLERIREAGRPAAVQQVDLWTGIQQQLKPESEHAELPGQQTSRAWSDAAQGPDSEVESGIAAFDQQWLQVCRDAGKPAEVDLLARMKRRRSSARLSAGRSDQKTALQSRVRIISMVVLAHVAALALIGIWLQQGGSDKERLGAPPHHIDVTALNAQLAAQQSAAMAPQLLAPVRQWLTSQLPAQLGDGRSIALAAMTALVTPERRAAIVDDLLAIDDQTLAMQAGEVLAWRAWALASDVSPEEGPSRALHAVAHAKAVAGGQLNWRVAMPLSRAEALLGVARDWTLVGNDPLTMALDHQLRHDALRGSGELAPMPLPVTFRPDQMDPVSCWAWTSLLRQAGGDTWRQWSHLLTEYHQQHLQVDPNDSSLSWMRSDVWQESSQGNHLATLSYAMIVAGL